MVSGRYLSCFDILNKDKSFIRHLLPPFFKLMENRKGEDFWIFLMFLLPAPRRLALRLLRKLGFYRLQRKRSKAS